MSQTDKNKSFEARVRDRLSGGAAELDAGTRARLRQARQAALTGLDRPRWSAIPVWVPAGGAIAVAVLATLLIRQGVVPSEIPGRAPAEDIEILLSGEDLELYEDLEFYAWLEMQPEVG